MRQRDIRQALRVCTGHHDRVRVTASLQLAEQIDGRWVHFQRQLMQQHDGHQSLTAVAD